MAMSGAERARRFRERERLKVLKLPSVTPRNAPVTIDITPDITPSKLTPVVTPTVTPKLAGGFISLCTVTLFGVALALNASYWAAQGQTPLYAGLFMAAGVAIEGMNFVMPTGIGWAWRLGHRWWAVAAVPIWAVVLGMAILADAGFASTNIGDSIATRAVAIKDAEARKAQRDQNIFLAHNSYDTWKRDREAECQKRGPHCREYEGQESVALGKWKEAEAQPLVTVPALAGADPLATTLAELGVPAEWANEARIIGWALVLALNGIVLDFGLLLMVARR